MNYAAYLSAAYNVGIILICAIVAYFTVVKKMDHNLQLRNIVFRGIISFLVGSVTLSIFSQFTSAIMISTMAIANPVSLQIFHIVDMVLCLGISAVYYRGSKRISMSFGYSHKQYQVIKLITAFLLGWIARQVLQLLMNLLLVILTTVF